MSKNISTPKVPVRASERLKSQSSPNKQLPQINQSEKTIKTQTNTTEETQKGKPQATESTEENPGGKTTQEEEQIETQPVTREQTTKMNQQQIQQSIASFVPEFSGNRANELIRFLGTADSVYETLTSNEEKKIFDRLIKLRLTGDAYTRIANRNVENYKTLREILNNIYSKSYSLEELEKKITTTQQSYGETIRNYGYRLMEALEKYKTGYKTKYNLQNIDVTYANHLNTTSVQAFKCGLNNTILKEKIATIKAKNIDDIISETETIEKLLTLTTGTPTNEETQERKTPNQTQMNPQMNPQRNNYNRTPITCNYCQRPGHTWIICRTRMNQERQRRDSTRMQPYNTTQAQRNQYPYQTRQEPLSQQTQNRMNQNYFPHTQNYPNKEQNKNFNPTSQHPYTQQYKGNQFIPHKYCSYCKTTTGHTFDECRSKFFSKNIQQTTRYNTPPPPNDTGEITNKFSNMRINMINPQLHQREPEQYQNQGNSNRSDQS